MTQRKLLKAWQGLSIDQKMVLYAYLSSCRDISLSGGYMRKSDLQMLGMRCDRDRFFALLEKFHWPPLTSDVLFTLQELGEKGFVRWPLEERWKPKRILAPRTYDFLLFSPLLSGEDINLRNRFYDKVALIKMAIVLQKETGFILKLIENNKFSKEQSTQIFQVAVCASPTLIVEKLMELGADFNAPDTDGELPVINAASRQKDVNVFKLLNSKGCSILEHCHYGNIIHCAAHNPNSAVLEYLLTLVPKEYIEEMNPQEYRTPLGIAYLWKKRKAAKILIKAGANKENAKNVENPHIFKL